MSEEAERLYERARALPPEARVAFIREACSDDPELHDELLSLLDQAEDAEDFFELLGDVVRSTSFPTVSGQEGSLDSIVGEAAHGFLSSSVSPELSPGHTIGHYRIVERISTGGMGAIYRARDTRLRRDVALKFLPTHLRTDDEAEHRLLDEARAAAALEHPNVCTVHEIGETDEGRSFIAMAFYRGETLEERLRRGVLSAREAAEVTAQLARGLAAAHQRGIVHQDVKPGNVMLTADGTVKLLDFGLAEMVEASLTSPGARRGTMSYMSPEQVRGEPLDPRTDLWSLGVVLYEMLTGVKPFQGADRVALLHAILHTDPEPITKRRPATPEPLARVVECLLEKEPDGRYDSADLLRADVVRAVPRADRISRHAAATRRRRSLTVISVVAVVMALVAGAIWLPELGEESAPAAAVHAAEPSIAVLPLTDLDPDRDDAALADGRDGSTRWSRTYDREAEDVFELQDEIARAVARELDLRPAGAADPNLLRHQSPNVAAYELYLRGTDQSLFRSVSGVRRGVQYFEQAIALDSTYAAAHAGLAIMYTVLSRRDDSGTPIRDLEVLADQAASKAVALDDSLAEAHAALGMVRQYLDYDFASAESELKRAMALDPSRARFRNWLAQMYVRFGRPGEALPVARRALEIDPLSPTAHAELAHALLANGQHDEALAQLQRIADLQPPLLRAAPYRAQAYAKMGMWPEAIAALRPQAEKGDSQTLALYGYMLARGGQRSEALRVRATLLDRWRVGGSRAFDVAIVYAGLGDFDRAFAWLDRSVDDGSAIRGTVHVMSPIFEELRSDPRFERLSRRLGLHEVPESTAGSGSPDRRGGFTG